MVDIGALYVINYLASDLPRRFLKLIATGSRRRVLLSISHEQLNLRLNPYCPTELVFRLSLASYVI